MMYIHRPAAGLVCVPLFLTSVVLLCGAAHAQLLCDPYVGATYPAGKGSLARPGTALGAGLF
jgi:hypothetical protein